MSPMSRFAIFIGCLIAVVVIASQPRLGASLSKSIKDMCVCVPTRASLIAKASTAKTRAGSTELSASTAPAGR